MVMGKIWEVGILENTFKLKEKKVLDRPPPPLPLRSLPPFPYPRPRKESTITAASVQTSSFPL